MSAALVSVSKGTEKGVEFATGNERNLCGHFAKAWATFLEHTLSCKDDLYLESKDLGSSPNSCDLDVYCLCISVLFNETKMMKIFSLPALQDCWASPLRS